jgi:hypothetical protein
MNLAMVIAVCMQATPNYMLQRTDSSISRRLFPMQHMWPRDAKTSDMEIADAVSMLLATYMANIGYYLW